MCIHDTPKQTCVPVLGANDGGFEMIAGTVGIGPTDVGGNMCAGRPIV